MAYNGDGLQYAPQSGFPPVPEGQWYQNPDPRQNQPQGLPVPGPQSSLLAPQFSAVPQPQFSAVPQPQFSAVPQPQFSAVPNIPSGLEYLNQVDQVLIHQKRHSLFQYNCEYDILNAVSQRIFTAQQQIECWGPRLDVRVYDNSQQHVLQLLLPSQFCSWETELEVYSPTSGGLIGYVVKNWTMFSIDFSILNIAKECVLRVVGAGFGMAGFSDINFEVKTSNESQVVGRISRVWRGFRKELFSSNDHYSVQFPVNLDAKVKALLMATGIFIDYLYFEQRNKNRH